MGLAAGEIDPADVHAEGAVRRFAPGRDRFQRRRGTGVECPALIPGRGRPGRVGGRDWRWRRPRRLRDIQVILVNLDCGTAMGLRDIAVVLMYPAVRGPFAM